MLSAGKTTIWVGAVLAFSITVRATPSLHVPAQGVAVPAAPVEKTAAEVKSEAVMLRVCGQCHDWQRVSESRRSRAEWGRVVDDMFTRGASGSDDDYNAVLEYVSRHNSLVNINRAPAEELMAVLGLVQEEADAIVTFRTANGKIADFDSLKKIPGLDAKKLDAVKAAIFY